MPFIGFDFPQATLLKGIGDAQAKNLEFLDYLIELINSKETTIPPADDAGNTNEQDAAQVAREILYMALRRDPDEGFGFFLVEELYSILHGETLWKKRSTGNRIQIGRMFGKLVASADAVEKINGEWRKIVPDGKTPQNQARYKTVVVQMLDELQ